MEFSGLLKEFIDAGVKGDQKSVDTIMAKLNRRTPFAITRFIDYSLGLVDKEDGIRRIEYYLFHGSQIQRNYASLYFNRAGKWRIVKQAFDEGLIDDIQAFAR